MRFVCVIATHGDSEWISLARDRAIPSTAGQEFDNVVMTHLPAGTLAQARNEGARLATYEHRADLIVFLDADDELEVGFGQAIRAAAAEHEPGQPLLLTPAVQYLHGRKRPAPKIWPRMPIEDGNWMVIGTAIQSSTFSLVGGFREWPMYEDWCLWQRAMKAGAVPVEVPGAVYVAHARQGSRNRAPSRQARLAAHNAIRRANYPELYEEAP